MAVTRGGFWVSSQGSEIRLGKANLIEHNSWVKFFFNISKPYFPHITDEETDYTESKYKTV